MTYQPSRLPPPDAAQAVIDGHLVPWREAATLLGVKFATLARWVDRGKLPYITVEGCRYVNIDIASNLEATTRHRRT